MSLCFAKNAAMAHSQQTKSLAKVDLYRLIAILVCLVGIFAFAIWQRFSLPLVPISDPDTWGYLRPALTWLSGEGMQQTHARSLAYPAFLLLPLAVHGTFDSIVVWQHVCGLLAGLAWWWIWSQFSSLLPAGIVRQWLAPLIGLIALFAFLCSAQRVVDELRLRPEAVFPLFALIQVGSLIAWLSARYTAKSISREAFWSGAAVFLALLSYSFKPSWGLAILLPPTVIALGLLSRQTARILPTLGAVLAAVICFVSLPSLLDWRKEAGAGVFLPMLLVGVHSDIIQRDLENRLSQGKLSAEETAFAVHFSQRVAESKADRGFYEKLGFDPDYLMFHSDALAPLPGPTDADSRKSAFYNLFLSSMAARPMDFVRKWATQLGAVYFQGPKSLFRESVVLALSYQSSLGTLPPATMPLPQPIASTYENLRIGDTIPRVEDKVRLAPSGTGDLGRLGAFWLFPASIGILGLATYAAFMGMFRNQRPSWGIAAWAASFVVLSALLSNLTVAFIHSFDIVRYLHLLAPLNWFVIGSAFVFAAFFAQHLLHKKHE